MRKVLLIGLLASGVPGGCAGHRAAVTAPPAAPPATQSGAASPAPSIPPATPPPDVFAAGVAPLLAKRCAPCHNPGGIMYERMPFDDPATVASHPEGILRRLKEPAERALVQGWIAARTTP